MALLSNSKKIEEAFDLLYSRYAKGLLVYAREFSLSEAEAEDIIQDVFLKVWEKLPRYPGIIEKSYLFRAARNGCLNYLERLEVRNKFQEETLKRGPVGALPAELYVADELREIILAAVDKLPQRQRESFLMNKFQNMSSAEIAEKLQISPRTVEKHIETASKTLRQDLKEYLPAILIALLTLPVN